MARSGSPTRGLISLPRRRRAFAMQPATRTGAAPGLSRAVDFKPGARSRQEGWQNDAFAYYKSLPPVGYVLDFKASTVAACDFVVFVDDAKKGRIPVEGNEAVDRLMASLVGPRGGIEELRRRAALLLEITGEAYFVGTPVEDEADAVFWEFLSTSEILPPDQSAGGGGKYRRNFGDGAKVDLPDDTYIARIWRSDPEFSSLAHCGLQRCLDTCRELVLLSRMTEAIIASRLPMGLLLIPDTVDWNPATARTDETSGSDTDMASEPDFLDDLIAHLSAPITDFGSASTLVPLVIRANKDDLEAVKIVDLARNLDQYAAGLRDEMYGRLAIGLDVPPEILEGKGGMNHWGSWNIDNEFLFKHVKPLGNLIADFLTYAYLRPLLVLSEGLTVTEAADYTVTFDPSGLANNQDDDQKARDLWDDGLISDRAVIEKQGWDPDTVMPDDDEAARRRFERLVLAKVVTPSDEGLTMLGLDPTWFKEAPPAQPFGGSPFGQPDEVTPTQPGVPDPSSAEDTPTSTAPRAQARAGETERLLVIQLATAADRDYERALERAGARIQTCSQRVPAFKGRFASTRTADIPSLVSGEDLAAIKVSTPLLLDGAWDGFSAVASEWFRNYLIGAGHATGPADASAAHLTAGLVAALSRWGVANFHAARVRSRSTGLRVPVEIVAEVVAEAQATRSLVAV